VLLGPLVQKEWYTARMRRFTALSLALIGLCTLTASASVVAGRQQPTAARLAMLRFTDCAVPCWIGIVPGRTSAEQARTIIKSVFGRSSDYTLSFVWSDTTDLLPVVVSEKDDPQTSTWIGLRVRPNRVIDSIVFSFNNPDQPVTLADMHMLFGVPAYVKMPGLADYRSGNIVLTYGSAYSGANVYTSRKGRLIWNQEVYTLIFYAHNLIPILPASDLRPWEGFRSVASYGTP
jgi:hypothetical protein